MMMREEMIKWGLREPEFEDKKLELVAIIHGAGEEIVETIEVSSKYGDLLLELNERQRKALKYLEKHGRITKKAHTELNKIPDRTAQFDLNILAKRGLIIKQGKGPSTYYVPAK